MIFIFIFPFCLFCGNQFGRWQFCFRKVFLAINFYFYLYLLFVLWEPVCQVTVLKIFFQFLSFAICLMCLSMKRKFLWTWSRSNVILGFIFLFSEHSRLNLSLYLLQFFLLQCYININERFWTHFVFCFLCCTGQLIKWVMMRLDQEKDKDPLSDRVISSFLWHLWQIGKLLSWH